MLQSATPRLILASASSARRAVLSAAGLAFDVQAAAIDEAAIKQSGQAEGAAPADVAILLAELKAERIARRNPEALVIGCDQLLVCDGIWFDKPTDPADAARHLKHLRGRTHELITAIVCLRHGQRIWHHVARPRLTMRDFSDTFLETYLAAEADHITACVGAYRLEGLGIHLFERIEGEHAAILGIPLLALLGFLRQHQVLAT